MHKMFIFFFISLFTLLILYLIIFYFTLGVLVNLHHDDLGGSDGCGTINIDAIQQVVAAKWAIDVINNQSLPHELKIGK